MRRGMTAEMSRPKLGVSPALVAAGVAICRHWLFVANLGLIVFSTLPFLAPILAALGLDGPATLIFALYSLTCHQLPSRSYFIFGHQMAYCERNTAIYLSMAAAGLAYARLRGGAVRSLSWRRYGLLILPMAVDGFTQLLGWRESTWLLRGATGALFGAATIWLAFPRLQESFDLLESELRLRLELDR